MSENYSLKIYETVLLKMYYSKWDVGKYPFLERPVSMMTSTSTSLSILMNKQPLMLHKLFMLFSDECIRSHTATASCNWWVHITVNEVFALKQEVRARPQLISNCIILLHLENAKLCLKLSILFSHNKHAKRKTLWWK